MSDLIFIGSAITLCGLFVAGAAHLVIDPYPVFALAMIPISAGLIILVLGIVL